MGERERRRLWPFAPRSFPEVQLKPRGGGEEWVDVEGEENPNELQWPITGVVRRQLLGPI
jgi:hypothetical protein